MILEISRVFQLLLFLGHDLVTPVCSETIFAADIIRLYARPRILGPIKEITPLGHSLVRWFVRSFVAHSHALSLVRSSHILLLLSLDCYLRVPRLVYAFFSCKLWAAKSTVFGKTN